MSAPPCGCDHVNTASVKLLAVLMINISEKCTGSWYTLKKDPNPDPKQLRNVTCATAHYEYIRQQ